MKCIFHIGPGKTGTSAIQTFMCNIRDSLNNLGYYYPTTGLWNKRSHNGLFLSKQTGGPLAKDDYLDQVAKLKQEIDNSRPHTVILSAEVAANFVNKTATKNNIELLLETLKADVHIVCFARRQDGLFDSMFKHFVRGSFCGTPWDFVETRYENLFFDQRLDRWAELRHVHQVSCVAYDSSSVRAGIDNFLRVAGLPPELGQATTPEMVNPSLDGQRLRTKYSLNQLNLDRRVDKRLRKTLAQSVIPNAPKLTLFDQDARDALMAIFESSNERLEARYECLLKPEPSSNYQVFEPLRPDELQNYVHLLKEEAGELTRSPQLAKKLSPAGLCESAVRFRPRQLTNRLRRLASAGIRA